MAPDAAATDAGAECEVMASVDSGSVDQFILAYPCRDDAWMSMPITDTAALDEWC